MAYKNMTEEEKRKFFEQYIRKNEIIINYNDKQRYLYFDENNKCFGSASLLFPAINGENLDEETKNEIKNMGRYYHASLEEFAYNVIDEKELEDEKERIRNFMIKDEVFNSIFVYNKEKRIIENNGRTFSVIKTYEDHAKAMEEKIDREVNNEGLSFIEYEEWECGFTFYKLLTKIDRDGWNLIKKHFEYCRRGWSEYHELEWFFGEPTGWLTQDIDEVKRKLKNVGYKIKGE